ncbi:MAG TPA: DUF2249 domain-containing protein [Candidatus Limnocylindrales bacterium]|nr:DUF2249 domain-containing protein [Candidatus Limnocylindrales bacterium]
MTAASAVPIVLGPPATFELTGCGIERDADPARHPPYESVFRALDRLSADQTIRLTVDHDPEPMLEALDAARPAQFAWEPLMNGPVRWVGIIRRRHSDEQPIPVRRLSPRLARRVSEIDARSRLLEGLHSIAVDLIGPSDVAALPPRAAAWVDAAAAEAVEAAGDLSLARLVERLDAVLASAPPEVSRRLDAAIDSQGAGIIL